MSTAHAERRAPLGAYLMAGAMAAPLVLSACASLETATDKAARDAAKTMMPEALAVYFPQVPKALFTPFTDCVVDSATGPELRILAEDAVVGVDTGTADTIRAILERPATQNCLATAAGAANLPTQ